MRGSPEVVVIGAGIVGAACARALAAQGREVLVLDARLGAATDAGMGHLVALDDNPAELALCSYGLRLWHELAPQLDASCAWNRCGTLWMAADDVELAWAHTKAQRLREAGVPCQWLDAKALAEAEPALRPGLVGALRVSGDATVYAPRVAHWLLAQEPRRLQFSQEEVLALPEDGSVRTQLHCYRPLHIVLAAGVHATRLCPELPVVPKKGLLVVTDRYPGHVHHQLVELGYMASAHQRSGASVAVNVQPRPTGQLLIGSTRQYDSQDASVDPALLAQLLRRAISYLPGLAGACALRSWSGLRPATPDGLPLIGRHPQRARLWLAVGHEGHGVTTALSTAEQLAALMAGASPPLKQADYAWRSFNSELDA
ncbi:NAD(P)/FAD-dependent oxidoreductase [Roseateles sp. BYS180W]|uniref:NAD(P)/FAD-dependent oxidoreductase n=1 Tax=Roseateles rivi TaxID=3299028 RepID=A0ABW7FWV9_9BURK